METYLYVASVFLGVFLFVWWMRYFHYVSKAEHNLARLRAEDKWGGEVSYPLYEYGWLIYNLNRGGDFNHADETDTRIDPRRIGSTKAELEEIRRKVWKYDAEVILKALRSGQLVDEPGIILNSLDVAGLTLADIGTSEEELSALSRKQYVEAAKEHLENFREFGAPMSYFAVLSILAQTDITWEEIGTTAGEMFEEMARIGRKKTQLSE